MARTKRTAAIARKRQNMAFTGSVREALTRRRFGVRMTAMRKAKGLTVEVVATRMGVDPADVIALEAGADVMVSTLQRYYAAIGRTRCWCW